MGQTPRLVMRQGQSLVMTPQLQQAIKLLQLSNLELAEFVEGELERNPLLERDERDERGERAEPDADTAPASDAPGELALDGGAGQGDAQAALDADFGDVYPDASASDASEAGAAPLVDWSRAGNGGSNDPLPDLAETTASERTLAEHLADQIAAAGFAPADALVAHTLAESVDDWGYVRADVAEIAERLGTDPGHVERVLKVCHGFEPTGVMARSVPECLALQLAERDRLDPAMRLLLDHLDLLGRRDFVALQRLVGVDREDLEDMLAEIRGLTPKPGLGFGRDTAPAVIPDVFVRDAPGQGGWLVELNTDSLPRLLVNQRYQARVLRDVRSDADRAFVTQCAADAHWLMKSLDQRARTILKVAREIVCQQDGFLVHGISHLRPLVLRQVADAIEMHESTVSRVTSNKYMATPRGVFELKWFFTAAIGASDGGDLHSAEAVRHRIRTLIAEEPPHAPLSDDRLVEILNEGGIDIARRTVAKYREALRIPSSVQRRRGAA
jgi:RNA polymerase sigma-54 factor